MVNSALYTGTVVHDRRRPVEHRFSYRIGVPLIDLDELEELDRISPWLSVEKFNWNSFRRRDYLGDPRRPLKMCVLDCVEQDLGIRPAGRVELMGQPSLLGYAFNPVSFYFCHGSTPGVEAVVAEITNTPWNERHAYVLSCRKERHEFAKAFHISPFMPMEQDYRWHLSEPGEILDVRMDNLEGGEKMFSAQMTLQRQELTTRNWHRHLRRTPAMTARMVAGIYWQALKLRIKGTPFHPHPKTQGESHADQQDVA